MKKLLSICIFTLLTTLLTAQVSKTLNVVTAGTLTTLLTAPEKTTVTDLTLTGNIDARDIKCLRDEVTMLATLDISSVSILAYSGSSGTSSSTSYSANQMPSYSFRNPYTNISKTSLKSILLPNSIRTIEGQAFFVCTGLNSITIPNLVTSIGMQTFDQCTGLINVTLGESVNSITSYNFTGCNKLKTITSLNSTPPALGLSCFSTNIVTSVYVPVSAISNYKTAAGWSDLFYSKIIANDGFGISLHIGSGGNLTENYITLWDGAFIVSTAGTTKTFNITPFNGYAISTLTYNGTDVKSQIINNQYTTPTSVNANSTLNITFQKIQYRLSLKDASTGSMNLLCDYGATPSFDFTPATGWKVNTVFYNSTDVTSSLVNGVYTVPTITANALLNVSFVSTATGAPQLINNRIKVYSTNSDIIVDGTSEGETVTLYTVSGKHIQTVISKGEKLNLSVDRNTIYLVKTGEKIFKVIL